MSEIKKRQKGYGSTCRISFGRNCIIGMSDDGLLTHLTDY